MKLLRGGSGSCPNAVAFTSWSAQPRHASRVPAVSSRPITAAVSAMTHRKRPTALAELTAVAVFLASDQASAMTGTVANLTGGLIVD